MKKIIKGIAVLLIIAGLGLGGYWLYRKYLNPDISSELEKIEINPDERKDLVENLVTKEDKINMIIQLIEDINYNRIIYNDEKFKKFKVKDKYEIDYIVDGVAVGDYDYLDRHYVAGGRNTGIMWVTGSNMVYVWCEYKKTCTYTGSDSTVVELDFEDELLCGKHDMGYKATAGEGTYYLQFSKKIKKYIDEMEFIEKDGIYCIKGLKGKKEYSNGQISEFCNFIVETDGVTYIHIRSEYEGKLVNGEDYYRYDHYIELNNKELYDKIIAPIKGIKNFPTIMNKEGQTASEALKQQSKYNHEQLMADYIASVEPKNQVWNVDKVDDVYTSVGIDTWHLKEVDEKNFNFLLYFDAYGKLEYDNHYIESKTYKYIGINKNFDIKQVNNATLYSLDIANNDNITIYDSASSSLIEDENGKLKDFSLHIVFQVNNDNSCSLALSGKIRYEQENQELIDASFKYNETCVFEFSKGYNTNYAKWKQVFTINEWEKKDSKGNKYVLNEKMISDDSSENHLLSDGETYSKIIDDLLKITGKMELLDGFVRNLAWSFNNDEVVENGLNFMLECYFLEEFKYENEYPLSRRNKLIGIKKAFDIVKTDKSTTYSLDIDSCDGILLYNYAYDENHEPTMWIEADDGELQDFSLHIIFVVNNDKSCLLQMSGSCKYKDKNGIMDFSFENNETIDSYEQIYSYIKGINPKWETKISLKSYSTQDKIGNRYIIINEVIIDNSENYIGSNGEVGSRFIAEFLEATVFRD